MTITERIAELLAVEAELARVEARKKRLRAELYDLALDRYRDDGAAPSWKAKGLGSVALVCPEPAPEVIDLEELAGYVAGRAPGELVTVPRPAYVDVLKSFVIVDPAAGACVDPDTGEKVPGMRARERAPYLTVRLDKAAKAAAEEASR